MSTWRNLFKSKEVDKSYVWTCGNDPKISHRKPVGSGGFGEVHEMLSKTTKQVFARKLVRLAGRVSEADIKNEAEVVSSIRAKGGHRNIIEVFDHGWLKGSVNVYFIDMELGDFTLADYIDYHGNVSKSSFDFSAVQASIPVLLDRNCTLIQRMHNSWAIASHIAEGLEFLHMHHHVHRDLKPSNVLYCPQVKLWKLTDFGLTTEATSKVGRPTRYSRGTANYRAPELLSEIDPVYTNKVDIWCLGCILHELATLKLTFRSDWEIQRFYETNIVPDISVPTSTEFLQHHICENIQELLHRDSKQRPRASDLPGIFGAYCFLLDLSMADIVLGATSFPTYNEWKQLVGTITKGPWEYRFAPELLYQLSTWYQKRSEEEISIALLEEIVRKFPSVTEFDRLLQIIQSAEKDCSDAGVIVLQRIGHTLTVERMYRNAIAFYITAVKQNPERLPFPLCFGELYVSKGIDEEALRMYGKRPEKLWLSWNFSQTYLARNDYDSASNIYDTGMMQLHSSVLCEMAWSNFYAAAGRYDKAISIYHQKIGMNPKDHDKIWSGLIELGSLVNPVDSPPTDDSLKYRRILLSELEPNIHTIKTFVTKDTIFATPYPHTGMHFAAWIGNADTIAKQVTKGIDVNTQDRSGVTPLHLAVWNMHRNVIKLLLSVPTIEPDVPDFEGSTSLHFAIWNNDAHAIKALSLAGADISAPHHMWNLTPMHEAARFGRGDAVKALIEAGADVSSKHSEGWTTVHLAAIMGHFDIANTLIEAGADVSGWAAIYRAAESGHSEVVKLLIAAGGDFAIHPTAIHRAATLGASNVVKLLIVAGANVSAYDEDGWTAMHRAAELGHSGVIKELIQAGANVSASDLYGWTVIHRAAKSGYSDVIKVLIEAGASVSVRDEAGWTPISEAAYEGHVAVVKLLWKAGADVNSKDKYGKTALHRARSPDVVKALLELGAIPSVQDKEGMTAMHGGAIQGNVDILKALIEGGANVSERSGKGMTPLDYADYAVSRNPELNLFSDQYNQCTMILRQAGGR